MKITMQEASINYNEYLFGYAQYCEQQTGDELNEIYNRGFLPYSANLTQKTNHFYLARSLRINVENFVDSSENRRVNRKIEPLNIDFDLIDRRELMSKDTALFSFCSTYAKERIGAGMPDDRLEYILHKDLATHFFYFSQESQPVGYVLAVITGKILHYWFSFFSTTVLNEYPIGKWMMWVTIQWAKNNGLKYVYLGTCYGTKSLYKARDFKGVEFFDGNRWNSDISELKARCKRD